MNVLQRDTWDGRVAELGIVFTVTKGDKTARCVLWSHLFGWELKLTVAGELVRTQVCRSQEEVLSTGESWRAAYEGKGWRAP